MYYSYSSMSATSVQKVDERIYSMWVSAERAFHSIESNWQS